MIGRLSLNCLTIDEEMHKVQYILGDYCTVPC